MLHGISVRGLVVFLVCLVFSNASMAIDFAVNKLADTADGSCDVSDCSLREAVIAANALPGVDTIILPAGNYVLTLSGSGEDLAATGDLDIMDDVTLTGAGSVQSIIDGNATDRVFHVMSGITANFSGITVRNGLADGLGGGLFNQGITTIETSHFADNFSVNSFGGAIENRDPNSLNAQLTITSSRFSGNCARSGGAIDSQGSLTIINSAFINNVPGMTSMGSCSTGDGAAVHLQGGTALIEGSTFAGNRGGTGAISIWSATVSIVNTTIMNNEGIGGIYTAVGAGGIENQSIGDITITNSTIAYNTGLTEGGGIHGSSLGSIKLGNTIVALNIAPDGGPDCSDRDRFPGGPGGGIESLDYNLIGSLADCGIVLQANDVTGDPGLGATVNLSVPQGAAYLPLLATSQAIDAGNNATCAADDQRGQVRPVDGDGDGVAMCDIGAIEQTPPAQENDEHYVYNYAWSNPFGGTGKDYAKGVATDAAGNIYVVGHFGSVVDFDISDGVDSRESAGQSDVYVTKLNADGSYGWTRSFGGVGKDYGQAIAVDDLGNSYLTGGYSGTVDFDPGAGVDSRTAVQAMDIFVTKLNADGSYGWTRTFGGTQQYTWDYFGSGIALDSAGGVVISGKYVGTVNFDMAGSGDTRSSLSGSYDMFLTKLGTDGSYHWTHSLGGTASDEANAVVIDISDNIYVTGSFSGTVDFDIGTGAAQHASAGGRDIFVAQYYPNGDFGWVGTVAGNSGHDVSHALALGENGELYIAGEFRGTVDFDPGAGVDHHSATAGTNAYISKWMTDGSYGGWTYTINGFSRSYSVAVGKSGGLFFGGQFFGTIDFDSGASVDSYTRWGSGFDSFMTHLKADGGYVWTKVVSSYSATDVVRGITVDPAGSVIEVGEYRDSTSWSTGLTDFDPGPAVDNYQSSTYSEAFVRKWDLDSDDDGMPDAFELANGLDPLNSDDAQRDNDGDGYTNVEEFLAGSDPNVPDASLPTFYNPGWMMTYGSYLDYEAAAGSAVDDEGNMYIIGSFSGSSTDFDPTAGVDLHASNGSADIYLVRVNADGSYGWTQTIGGTSRDYGRDIAVDNVGNIYLMGTYEGTVNFDPAGVGDIRTATGSIETFVTKLNADGSYSWTRVFGEPVGVLTQRIALDANGDIYVIGNFAGSNVDFDPGTGIDMRTAAGAGDVFVTKLNSDGSYGWTRTLGGNGPNYYDDIGVDIVVADGGDIYIAGKFSNTVDFGWGGVSESYTAGGTGSTFITRILADGRYGWTQIFSGGGTNQPNGINADASGNIYVTGWFSSTVDFDPTASVDQHSGFGFYDIYLTKLNVDGSYGWTQTFGGANGYDRGERVVVGKEGDIFLAGTFQRTVDFDPGPGTNNITVSRYPSVFLSRFTPGGGYVETKIIVSSGSWDSVQGLEASGAGDLYMTGMRSGRLAYVSKWLYGLVPP